MAREEHGLALAEGPQTTYNLGEEFLIYSGSTAKGINDVARSGKKYGYYLYEGEDLRGDELLKKGDKVVVKEILLKPLEDPHTRELPDAIREQLRREVVLQAQMRHRNLVRVHYSCITPTKLFIIREKIEGDTLADKCAKRPSESPALSFHEAGSYFNQLVSAVSFLHSQRVCHRGLTSDNCIIDKSGCLKIQDFGLAIVAEEGMCVTLCGSPLFWPPEMVANQIGRLAKAYNGAAMDVWSMGMILHCMLAGKVPKDMKRNTKDGEPSPVVLFLDEIHPEDETMEHVESAKDLIKRMLDPDPITRITIDGVVQHLRERPWCDIPYEEPSDSTVVAWEGSRHIDLTCEPMPGPYVPLSLFELVGTVNPVWMAQGPASQVRQTGDLTDTIEMKLSKYQVWRRLWEWEDVADIGPYDSLGIRLELRNWKEVEIQVRMCEVFVEREVATVVSVIVMSKTSWEDFRKIASEIKHRLKCDKISRAINAGNRFERVWGEHPEVDEEEK